MKKIFGILFAVVLVVSLGLVMASPVLAGTTIHVPGDYPTIQEAIDAAAPGDTIMVAVGTYAAFQVIGKNNIHIIGAKGATVTTANLIKALPVVGNAMVMAAVYESENINIEGINFDGTGVSGIHVCGIVYVDSTGRIVDLTVKNIIGTELGAGVAIIGYVGTSTVEMTGATISNNYIGIFTSGNSNLEAHFNNIVGNSEFGVLNYGGGTVNAARNWWGHYSGPYHEALNPHGTGVEVSDNVDFKPWLGADEVVTQMVLVRGTVDARAAADAWLEVDGNANVTVYRYGCNPGGPPPTDLTLLGKYFNVYLPDTTQVNEIEIRLYYTDDELDAVSIDEKTLRLYWWDGNEWEPFSDTGVNTDSTGKYSGYMWAKITAATMWARMGATTTRSLSESELNIDIDGGPESPSPPPQPPVCCMASVSAASGTNAANELDTLRKFRDTVLLPNSLGAQFVSLYYKTSPPVADFISRHELLKIAVRVCLVEPIVTILNWNHDLW